MSKRVAKKQRKIARRNGRYVCRVNTLQLFGGSLLALTSAAHGQPADSIKSAGIEEVIVSAQRRDQVVSDVGVSIAVVNAENLANRAITSTSDLSKAVPGFTAADSSLNVPVYSIRGVGINESSLAANSTVAVAVEEIPLPYTAMTSGALLDIQQIEVLRGPQGTLYGLNATGGAINYLPNQPTDSFEAGYKGTYGRFNTLSNEVFVSGPLFDSLKGRVAVSRTTADDWQESYTRDDSLGEVDKTSARILLNWANAADTITADFMASGWIDKSDSPASQATAFRAQSPANVGRIPQTFAQPLYSGEHPRRANWTPGLDYGRDDKFGQLALKLSFDLTDDMYLLSTTAYSYFKDDALVDRDGIETVNYHAYLDGMIRSKYQELRLAGETDALTWSVGANYRDDEIDDDQSTFNAESTIGWAAGRPIPNNFIDTYQTVKAYGIFADGEYQLDDQLSVVAGVRYTEDKRDFKGCAFSDAQGSQAFTVIMNSFHPGNPLPAIQGGQCFTLSKNTYIPGYVESELNEDNVAYKLGLNYRPIESTLLYASISRGYKAGSFPTLGAVFAVGFDAATQEKVDAYEIGFKSLILDHTLQLNGAAFYYDYTDKQLRGRIIDPNLGSLSKLVNIPKSEIMGAELESVWAPVDGLTINGAVSYIETEIKEYTGVNLYNQLQDYEGAELNYVPTWSVNIGAEYTWPIAAALNMYAGADVTYRSETSGFIGNDPDMGIDAYTTLDLRVGVKSDDGRWRVGLFGNNVTNEYYWTSVNRGSDTIFRYAAKPATYGIAFDWNFM